MSSFKIETGVRSRRDEVVPHGAGGRHAPPAAQRRLRHAALVVGAGGLGFLVLAFGLSKFIGQGGGHSPGNLLCIFLGLAGLALLALASLLAVVSAFWWLLRGRRRPGLPRGRALAPAGAFRWARARGRAARALRWPWPQNSGWSTQSLTLGAAQRCEIAIALLGGHVEPAGDDEQAPIVATRRVFERARRWCQERSRGPVPGGAPWASPSAATARSS